MEYQMVRGKVKGTGYPIDGLELIFSLWDYDNRESYHLSLWNKEDDEAVMMTMYQSENEAGFCVYATLEDFTRAWKAGEYEPECSFCLAPDNVDVLAIIQEERSNGEGGRKALEETQTATREAEPDEDVDTWSDDYVICPYCGEALETNVGYPDFPEIYEDGDHELECPECGKTFILNTMVSYSWETAKKDGESDG